MACRQKIKPFIPGGCRVEPAGELRLDDGERALFDSIAEEVNETAGTEITYYAQVQLKRDPLYDEPIERGWKAYKLWALFEHPTGGTPEMREEGFRITWRGNVTIARKAFEDAGAPYPSEGDVIHAWDVPFFEGYSTITPNVPKAGYYFDVVDVNDDGHINDSASFVQFVMEVVRRTEMTAERRVFGES